MTRLAILILVLRAAPLWAAVYHIAPAGDDTAAGTEQAPWQTLQATAAKVNPGDTVLMHGGLYPPGVTLGRSGTAERPITFKPAGDGEVRVWGRLARLDDLHLAPGRQHTCVVDDPGPVLAVTADLTDSRFVCDALTVVETAAEVEAAPGRYCYDARTAKLYVRYRDAGPLDKPSLHVLRDQAGLAVSGAHIIVEGINFSRFSLAGVTVGPAEGSVLRRCKFFYCGYPWGAAVSLYQSQRFTVEDCAIWTVMNGLMIQDCTGCRFLHNSLFRSRAHGFILNHCRDTVIRNNIIYAGGPSGAALYVGEGAAQGLDVDYNCYLDSGSRSIVHWVPLGLSFPTFWDYEAQMVLVDRHSCCGDPKYVSTAPGQEDLRLRPASHCQRGADDGADLGVRWP
jgi:hypothetical protein